MATGKIETLFGDAPAFMDGKIQADCFELGGVNPTSIIRSDQAWEVRIDWTLEGPVVALINDDFNWHLHAMLESMGPGPESSIAIADFDWGPAPVFPNTTKNWQIAHTFSEDFIEGLYSNNNLPHESALFKIFAVLTLRNDSGVPLPFAGNVEMGNVQYFRVPE